MSSSLSENRLQLSTCVQDCDDLGLNRFLLVISTISIALPQHNKHPPCCIAYTVETRHSEITYNEFCIIANYIPVIAYNENT